MRPRLVAAMSGLLLAAMLPATVTAEGALRFQDHHIGLFCEQPIDGGFAAIHVDVSDLGDNAGTEVWLDPAVPFEEPPTLSGSTEDVSLTVLSEGFALAATFAVFDPDGNEVGEGSIDATLTLDGPLETLTNDRFGNRNTIVSGTFQPMDVSGTLTLPTLGTIDLDNCGGDETFVKVVETNPHAFVNGNAGVAIDCFWVTESSVAGFFAIADSFGTFADAFLDTSDHEFLATGQSSVDFTTSSLSVVVELADVITGDPAEATAAASLEPVGDPYTSIILTSGTREKLIEQRLSPSGELAFSNGHTFAIDDASCFANAFDSHQVNTGPAGPKAGGRAPSNDTVEGAIPLTIGSSMNMQTGGAAIEPEVPNTTCEEGTDDSMGRTVWYTFEGTGEEVTLDTAGSNFDTVVAVYVLDGDELVELACVDDVFFDPIGLSFQAAITGPTVEGETYYIQVGGFDSRSRGGDVEFGRLRVTVY